jgi:hypothetical protein
MDSNWSKLLFAILNHFTFHNENEQKYEFLSVVARNDFKSAFEEAKKVLLSSGLLRKFRDEKRVDVAHLIANLQTEFFAREDNITVSVRDEL